MDADTILGVVRDRDTTVSLELPCDFDALTLIASLSANPTTFDELAKAWERYRPIEPLESFDRSETPAPFDLRHWLVVDLARKQVRVDKDFDLPEGVGAYGDDQQKRDDVTSGDGGQVGVLENDATDELVFVNLPPEWTMESTDGCWPDSLGRLPELVEPIDVRGILYGRALAEFLASRVARCVRDEQLPDRYVSADKWTQVRQPSREERRIEFRWRKLTIRIHSEWLLTCREDLGGAPPRELLHRGRCWVEQELMFRASQWLKTKTAPPGLDKDAFAYRYGPFGRFEVIAYYDLCRELIAEACRRVVETPDIDNAKLASELFDHSRKWLRKRGVMESVGAPVAELIESERRLVPITGDASHLDCDCPLCRVMADDPAPMFIAFDGKHLDFECEFAFSLCETRKDWDAMQLGFHEHMEQRVAEREDPNALPMQNDELISDEVMNKIWELPFGRNEEPPSVISLAARFSELVGNMKQQGARRGRVRRLNDAFDNYRTASPGLLQSASKRLVDALEKVASDFPELTSRAADLQSQLDADKRSMSP